MPRARGARGLDAGRRVRRWATRWGNRASTCETIDGKQIRRNRQYLLVSNDRALVDNRALGLDTDVCVTRNRFFHPPTSLQPPPPYPPQCAAPSLIMLILRVCSLSVTGRIRIRRLTLFVFQRRRRRRSAAAAESSPENSTTSPKGGKYPSLLAARKVIKGRLKLVDKKMILRHAFWDDVWPHLRESSFL